MYVEELLLPYSIPHGLYRAVIPPAFRSAAQRVFSRDQQVERQGAESLPRNLVLLYRRSGKGARNTSGRVLENFEAVQRSVEQWALRHSLAFAVHEDLQDLQEIQALWSRAVVVIGACACSFLFPVSSSFSSTRKMCH